MPLLCRDGSVSKSTDNSCGLCIHIQDITRLLKTYTSLKDVILACVLTDKQLPRFMFTLSLGLASEGIIDNTHQKP